MAFLRANNGPNIGREFELIQRETLVGRHPSCEVVVQDSAISRRHAKIDVDENGDYYISDLQSRNGTQVNGQSIKTTHKLMHGDRIQICDTVFSFFLERDDSSRTEIPGSLGGSSQGGATRIITEFVDDGGASASSIRRKVEIDSSHVQSDQLVTHSKLETLIEITRALSQTLALDEVIPTVLESLFKIFPQGDRAFIVLCNNDGELGQFWVKDRKDRNTKLRVSRTIIKEAMESREAILSEDAFSDERFDLSKSIAGFSIRSVMCAPLLDNNGNAIGCLQIDTMDPGNKFTHDELDLLATVAMQAGVSVVNARMHEEALHQRAIERDLELAREVQLGLLPNEPPSIPGFSFFDYYEAANKVGGDFFDYIELEDGRFAVVIADVAGHGIASALLMAKFSAEVRFALFRESSASQAVNRINNAIIRLNLRRFITMVLAVIDPAAETVTVVNAGHPDPILKTETDARPISREIAGLPIGIEEDFEFQEQAFDFGKNRTLVLYTDGINEAMDANGEQFGNRRVLQTVRECENQPNVIGNRLIELVSAFEDSSVDNDDMCLVSIGHGV